MRASAVQRTSELFDRAAQDDLLQIRNDLMTVYREFSASDRRLFPLRYARTVPRRPQPSRPRPANGRPATGQAPDRTAVTAAATRTRAAGPVVSTSSRTAASRVAWCTGPVPPRVVVSFGLPSILMGRPS